MDVRKFQAVNPNSAIWSIYSAVLSSNFLCLMKAVILKSKQTIFFAFPSKYSLIPKIEIGQKLLSYNCGFAS